MIVLKQYEELWWEVDGKLDCTVNQYTVRTSYTDRITVTSNTKGLGYMAFPLPKNVLFL